ncbi:hypothetical protein CDL15_Pgr009467 [Punica granatum]|nr:hypothetical protein CDL15_Pgr009467 [Punica granatum]
MLDENPPHHGDNESGKSKVGGDHPKPAGSHVGGTPTSSHSPNPAGYGIHSTRMTSYQNRNYIPTGETAESPDFARSAPADPDPLEADQDPLEAYHFNCTLCD